MQQVFVCREIGEVARPFRDIAEARQNGRQLSVDSPIVVAAARVCANCMIKPICDEQMVMSWVHGRQPTLWPEIETPVVVGGLYASRDRGGNRQLLQVDVWQDVPAKELALIGAHAIGGEVTIAEDMPEPALALEPVGITEVDPDDVLELDQVYKMLDDACATAVPVLPTVSVYDIHISSSIEQDRAEEDAIRDYMSRMKRYPLLTIEQERDTSRKIRAGLGAFEKLADTENLTNLEKRELNRMFNEGVEAHQWMVGCNLRLVVSIAKKYRNRGLSFLDLIQEGNIGLMHAADKFNPEKGFKFSTYATYWVRQAITRGLSNKGSTIRIPVNPDTLLRSMRRNLPDLVAKLGRNPTYEEVAIHFGVSEKAIRTLLAYDGRMSSLSETAGHDDDRELSETIPDRSQEASLLQVVARGEVDKLLGELDERSNQIMRMRFGLDDGEPRTLEDVGKHFNLTRERIRQLEAKALGRLRHEARTRGIEF